MKSIILAPFTLIYPKVFFLFFVLVRPIVDIYSYNRFIGRINLASILTLFLILLYPLELLKRRKIRLENSDFMVHFNILFSIFLFVSLFSFIYSKNISISLMDLARLISILAVFNYVAIYCSKGENPKLLINVIIISSILPVCFGLYQFLFGKGSLATPGFNRIYGTFVHPNVFAQYLLLVFFLLLFVLATFKIKKIYRRLLIVYSVIMLFSLYNTFARGAWIAVAIGVLIFIFLKTKLSKKIIHFSLILILLLALSPYLQKRWEDITQPQDNQVNSLEWRVNLWRNSVAYLQEHPFIGNGLGMYEEKMGQMAHNDYLKISYETGLLGLIFYLILLCYVLFGALRNLFKAKSLFEINRYKIILCIIVSLLTMSLADNLARSTLIMIYYFFVISILFNFPQLQNLEDKGNFEIVNG